MVALLREQGPAAAQAFPIGFCLDLDGGRGAGAQVGHGDGLLLGLAGLLLGEGGGGAFRLRLHPRQGLRLPALQHGLALAPHDTLQVLGGDHGGTAARALLVGQTMGLVPQALRQALHLRDAGVLLRRDYFLDGLVGCFTPSITTASGFFARKSDRGTLFAGSSEPLGFT